MAIRFTLIPDTHSHVLPTMQRSETIEGEGVLFAGAMRSVHQSPEPIVNGAM